jgi:cytochrome c oxidase cbb3-type subunit 2
VTYRLLPHVQLVLVRIPGVGDDYRIDYHYAAGPVGGKGPVIPWLSDLQREQLLREGKVEEIEDGDSPAVDGEAAMSAVDNCIAALKRLNVPASAGAPACRTSLRDGGFRFGNSAIAAAVKRRKDEVATVRDSA